MQTGYSKVEQVKISQNTRLLFKPVHADAYSTNFRMLSGLCSRVGGVEVAYLSYCKLPSENETRTVIVVGMSEGQCPFTLANSLMRMLQGFEFRGQPVDVLPMNASAIPAAVLQTGLRIA